jgi:hypothetical protein
MEIEPTTSPATDTSASMITVEGEGSALTAEAPAVKATTPSAESGGPAPAWMAQLEGDLKSDKSLSRYKTITEAARAHRELEGKLSKSVVLPDDKSSAEERAAFYKRMGVPADPKEYKLETPKLPEGFDYKSEDDFKAFAQKLNLTQAQAKDMHQWHLASMVKALVTNLKAVKVSIDDCKATLRTEFGEKSTEEIGHAIRGLDRFADKGGVCKKLLAQSGLGNHPEIIKMFARINHQIGEGAGPAGNGQPVVNTGIPGKRTDAQLAEMLYGKKGA